MYQGVLILLSEIVLEFCEWRFVWSRLALWCSKLSWRILKGTIGVPAASLPMRLPTNVPKKAAEDGLCPGKSKEFWTLGFSLAQWWSLHPFGKWASGQKFFLSVSPSGFLSVFFQMNEWMNTCIHTYTKFLKRYVINFTDLNKNPKIWILNSVHRCQSHKTRFWDFIKLICVGLKIG